MYNYFMDMQKKMMENMQQYMQYNSWMDMQKKMMENMQQMPWMNMPMMPWMNMQQNPWMNMQQSMQQMPWMNMPMMPMMPWMCMPFGMKQDDAEGSENAEDSKDNETQGMPFPFMQMFGDKSQMALQMMLQMLMQIDLSPETLKLLKKFMDHIFDLYSRENEEEEAAAEEEVTEEA